MPKVKQYYKFIGIKVTPEIDRDIRGAAAATGKSISKIIREACAQILGETDRKDFAELPRVEAA